MEFSGDYSNDQEVFDFVVTRLVEQGCKSRIDGRCAYRGANGARCAAGWLLPDIEYDYCHEGDVSTNVPWFQKCGVNASLLRRLQMAHDRCPEMNFTQVFLAEARLIARDYRLKMSELEEPANL